MAPPDVKNTWTAKLHFLFTDKDCVIFLKAPEEQLLEIKPVLQIFTYRFSAENFMNFSRFRVV